MKALWYCLDRIGSKTSTLFADTIGIIRLTVLSAIEAYQSPRAARNCIHRIWLQQMKFTGVDALGITISAGLIVGAIVTFQSMAILPKVGAADLLGKIMALVVIRELGPLLVAFIVIGRSGTAMSVELGTMAVGGEVDALRSLGIRPRAYVVFPRVAGVTMATLLLLVYFDLAALAGGYAASSLLIRQPPGFFLASLAAHVQTIDLIATVAKGLLFGAIVSSVACYYGLSVERATTEIPQAGMKAVVVSMLFCLMTDLLLSLGYVQI